MEQLSRSEEQVMVALGPGEHAATRRQIAANLPAECRWADSTPLNSCFGWRKSTLSAPKSRATKNLYTPLVRRLTYCGAGEQCPRKRCTAVTCAGWYAPWPTPAV